MTVGRLFFQAILLTVVFAAALLGFSLAADKYYKSLEEDVTSKIKGAYHMDIVHPGNDDEFKKQIRSKIDSSRCYKVVVSDSNGRIYEHRYYISSQVRILDQIGDHGRTTKRIIKDEQGSDRVTVHYNDWGYTVLREYRDKRGEIIKRWRNDYLPFGGRTGY